MDWQILVSACFGMKIATVETTDVKFVDKFSLINVW